MFSRASLNTQHTHTYTINISIHFAIIFRGMDWIVYSFRNPSKTLLKNGCILILCGFYHNLGKSLQQWWTYTLFLVLFFLFFCHATVLQCIFICVYFYASGRHISRDYWLPFTDEKGRWFSVELISWWVHHPGRNRGYLQFHCILSCESFFVLPWRRAFFHSQNSMCPCGHLRSRLSPQMFQALGCHHIYTLLPHQYQRCLQLWLGTPGDE